MYMYEPSMNHISLKIKERKKKKKRKKGRPKKSSTAAQDTFLPILGMNRCAGVIVVSSPARPHPLGRTRLEDVDYYMPNAVRWLAICVQP